MLYKNNGWGWEADIVLASRPVVYVRNYSIAKDALSGNYKVFLLDNVGNFVL